MAHHELTNIEVEEVRRRVSNGESFADLAKEYGCFESDIADCVNQGLRMPWFNYPEKKNVPGTETKET